MWQVTGAKVPMSANRHLYRISQNCTFGSAPRPRQNSGQASRVAPHVTQSTAFDLPEFVIGLADERILLRFLRERCLTGTAASA